VLISPSSLKHLKKRKFHAVFNRTSCFHFYQWFGRRRRNIRCGTRKYQTRGRRPTQRQYLKQNAVILLHTHWVQVKLLKTPGFQSIRTRPMLFSTNRRPHFTV